MYIYTYIDSHTHIFFLYIQVYIYISFLQARRPGSAQRCQRELLPPHGPAAREVEAWRWPGGVEESGASGFSELPRHRYIYM